MSEIITVELKSDLEGIYKIAGVLLNDLEMRNFSKDSEETRELIEYIKFKLMEIGGTLQKDIFNCDFILTKMKSTGNYSQDMLDAITYAQ